MAYLFTPKYDEPTGRYCGPTAICAVTGLPLSEVKAAIRQASGKIMDAAGRSHRVSGVANKDLLGAMELLGWNVSESLEIGKKKSDLRFCDFLNECGSDGPYIVNVTGHYIAVGWGEICDPFNPLGASVAAYLARKWKRGKSGRYQNAWVQRWWKFDASTKPAGDA